MGSGNSLQVPMYLVCVASYWDTAVEIWFRPQKGAFDMFGIGREAEDRNIHDASWVHSGNIISNNFQPK